MTNKEIIIKEADEFVNAIKSVPDKEINIHRFATNLLAKLQVLDRDKVDLTLHRLCRKIIDAMNDKKLKDRALDETLDKAFKDSIKEICQLIPEGEVIAEGKLEYCKFAKRYLIDNKPVNDCFGIEHDGKKIIIRVVEK